MQSSSKVMHLAHYISIATLSSMLIGKLTRVPPFSFTICKSLFSFLYEHLNPHIKMFKRSQQKSYFVPMWDKNIYVRPCLLTLIGSKTNLFSDNTWE